MGGQKSGRRARARQVEGLSNISTFGGGARISRAALLAGASLVALAAPWPRRAGAGGVRGADRTISTSRTGPVFSTRRRCRQRTGGEHTGGPGGVYGRRRAIGALTIAGAISGAAGAAGRRGRRGRVERQFGTTSTLTNSGTISGGNGGGATGAGGAGGAGVSNAGTITTLTNSGAISGGNGGAAPAWRLGRRGRRGRVERRRRSRR